MTVGRPRRGVVGVVVAGGVVVTDLLGFLPFLFTLTVTLTLACLLLRPLAPEPVRQCDECAVFPFSSHQVSVVVV
jgi:hypothetical protein